MRTNVDRLCGDASEAMNEAAMGKKRERREGYQWVISLT
jgi:hypothetical protein